LEVVKKAWLVKVGRVSVRRGGTIAGPVARAWDNDVAPFTICVATMVRTALTGVMLMVETRHWLRAHRTDLLSGAVGSSVKLDAVNDDVLHLVEIEWRG
jgi:hypothetical protein